MLIKNISGNIIKVKNVMVPPDRQLFITPSEYNKLPAAVKVLFMVTMTDCPFEELEQATISERIKDDD